MMYPILHINQHTFKPGKYYLDELGNVYSEEQFNPGNYRTLKGFPDGCRGYLKLKLYNTTGKGVTVSIHRLVYTTISNIPYNSAGEINHIDGNILNNAYANFELVSSRENVRHSIYNKLSPSRAHQLTLGDAIQVYGYLIDHVLYKTYTELARDIGYDPKVVKQLLNKNHPLSDEIDDYFSHQ